MPPSYHVSTTTVDTTSVDMSRADRLEYWCERISSFHCTVNSRVLRPDDFQGRATCQRTQSYQLVAWGVSTPQWVQRTKRHIHTDPDERYRLVLTTSGSLALRDANNQRVLTAGAGALFTVNTPFDLGVGSRHRGMILTMPRREIDHRLGRAALLNPEMDLTRGLGRLIHTSLVTLKTERHSLSATQFDRASQHLTDLVCLLVLGDTQPPTSHAREIETQIRQHVRGNARDSGLNTESIAQALGWSQRQIQTVLRQAGTTPSELIRQERLHYARQQLENPANVHKTITQIAYESGFNSAHTFTKAFRQHFGHTPKDHRDH
ncbi:AraC family transcriptional regulator [Saccharopolyspora spinosa]|uniref:AraC family transcriptional regulator n=1 Tax=Saccharopolyspora spinosa TaxID=60894 RepID=A0A2N3Y519_SACSN|nr:AraC family transcriptional regulator [Saccharopolyspora spinosa]